MAHAHHMTMETAVVTIESLIAGGRGRATLDGLQVFVPWTAPQDHVRVAIHTRHKNYAEAHVVEMITPGPDRVTPRCPVFGACGGCQWQHLSYDVQLTWKQRILQEQLERIGKITAPLVRHTIAAPSPWQYRSRIHLQVDATGHVGFYRAGTHEVVEFDECAIAAPELNAQLATAKERLRSHGHGRTLRLDSDDGFSQVNVAQNIRLQQLVRDGVAAYGGGAIAELYCGRGNLTFPIAEVAQSVVAADDDAQAIDFARRCASAQQIANVTFVCTSAARLLQRVQHDHIEGVIVDPPRRGAAEVIDMLQALHPRWIGYVSCDPATLARDVRALIAGGYRHVVSQPIDMFPQTFHIESLTWLERSG